MLRTFLDGKKIWGGSRIGCHLLLVWALAVMLGVSFVGRPVLAEGMGQSFQVAQAEGFNPFKSFFKMFQNKKEPKKQQAPRTTRKRAPAAVQAAPKIEELPKNPDAGVILVVGDEMAKGLAEGLRHSLANQPAVRVDMLIHERRGLAGLEAPNWEADVLSRARGASVEAVVVMLGSRDRGESLPGDPPVAFLNDGWSSAYLKKVQGLVRVVRRERLPIVWVSLPPTGAKNRNDDFLELNSLFRRAAEDRRTRFVDIWDIFLSEQGTYSSYGPDVDGKRRKLRSDDRIGFTWAGNQKVAFFVERELLRLLGGYGGLAFEGVEDDPNFIVLTGRTTSPEAELLGGDARIQDPDKGSATYGFLVRGENLPRVPGRVDDTQLQ
ncbi:SGNH/GDSL hydrolase family protein [Roseibium sediminis]|uniref:SGNH/GDSL hydrolase family protein n=1 Tax=Roseibium sediminis TaxID=1775174 RepID=UPI001AD8A231|nr:GDSL-type esterase/lipase family protein [Roseibium sediminis]